MSAFHPDLFVFGIWFTIGSILQRLERTALGFIKEKETEIYDWIIGADTWLYESGGESPAETPGHIRFFKFLFTNKANEVIGRRSRIHLIIFCFYISFLHYGSCLYFFYE